MDREVLRKRIARNQRRMLLQNCIQITVCVVVALLLITVTWAIAKPFVKKVRIDAEVEQAATVLEAHAGTNPLEDGSGDVTKVELSEEKVVNNTVPGWQVDQNGWWYAADAKNYYSNGWLSIGEDRYHFDADGYMSTGWKAIGGKGYYFGEGGVYDADRDSSKVIALTFDDGPGPYTRTLLDILEAHDAKATFFLQGVNIESYGEGNIARMTALGCAVGNHSYDHPNMKKMGAEVAQSQFAMTDELIAKYNNGQGATVVRFPYGEYTRTMAKNTGRSCWFWDLDTLDWKTKNVQANISAVLDGVEGGQIILMHDIHKATVDACQTIIPELIKRGYELVTVEELAAANGYEAQPGVTYYSFTQTAKDNNTVTDKTRTNVPD